MSRLLLDYQEFQHYVLNITFPEFGFECSLILTNIPAAAIGYLISMFILWLVANFNLQFTVISLDFPFLKQGFTLLLAWGKVISGKFHQALNSMHSCATGNDNLGNSI